MVDDKIETILQANGLQGLPMASESNIFPVIPDTDSFLLVPKKNDSGKKDDSVVIDDHHQDARNVGGPTTTKTTINGVGHIRRFSTGNITIPYTKVKILSRYLAASTSSCHDYCKYGARKEGQEDDHEVETHNNNNNNNNTSSTFKRFNDTLGKGHHHEMFKQATATLMERRKKMAISHVTPAKTTVALMTTCFGSPKPDFPLSAGRREVTSNKKGTIAISEVSVSPKPRRPDHFSSKNDGTTNNNSHPSRLMSSSSTSDLGVFRSPKRDVSPFVMSRTPPSKLGTIHSSSSSSSSSSSNVEFAGCPKPQKSTRSVSVSKVETSSSSTNKLPILSKVFSSSSSSLAEVGAPSSSNYTKPQRVEAFLYPYHRRGASMSKLTLSYPIKDIEDGSKTCHGTHQRIESRRHKSQLPKSLSAKEDMREQRSKQLEGASVVSPSNRNTNKGSTRTYSNADKETIISSPTRHKFLRRQSILEPLKSPARSIMRLNRGKIQNKKAISHPKEDLPTNNSHVMKAVEANQPKDKQVDPIITSAINDAEESIATHVRGSTTTYSPVNKHEANKENVTNQSAGSPSTRTRKLVKRAKNHVHGSTGSPLFHDKYKILRRSRARSVISKPMAGSKNCHSVISSTESCETDLFLEQKAMERVLASSETTNTITRRTRRGTILTTRDHDNKDEQPRKLNFRPGRVIEFKPEISSPMRLKFKRRALRNDNSPHSKVDMISIGVLRKGGGGRREGIINRRVEFADHVVDAAKRVVLRHQDMQGEKVVSQASLNNVIEETASKLVEDRKSKVKALVGAFESLITLQDSRPILTITV